MPLEALAIADPPIRVLRYAPVVAAMVASHVGGGAAAPVREGALAQLVAELSDEQVQAIAASGVLPSHAAALLVEVRKHASSHLIREVEARDASRLEEVTDIAAAAIASRFGRGPVDGKIQAHIIRAAR